MSFSKFASNPAQMLEGSALSEKRALHGTHGGGPLPTETNVVATLVDPTTPAFAPPNPTLPVPELATVTPPVPAAPAPDDELPPRASTTTFPPHAASATTSTACELRFTGSRWA
jgi:hypothetical protein